MMHLNLKQEISVDDHPTVSRQDLKRVTNTMPIVVKYVTSQPSMDYITDYIVLNGSHVVPGIIQDSVLETLFGLPAINAHALVKEHGGNPFNNDVLLRRMAISTIAMATLVMCKEMLPPNTVIDILHTLNAFNELQDLDELVNTVMRQVIHHRAFPGT